MNDQEFVKRIVKHVKPNAMIQGGAYRVDRGPTPREWRCFRLAVLLHEECKKEGVATEIACIVNDLGLSPQDRPKTIASQDSGSIPLTEEGMRRRKAFQKSLSDGLSIPELYYDLLLRECSSQGQEAVFFPREMFKIEDVKTFGEAFAISLGDYVGEVVRRLVPLTFFSESALRNRASEDKVSSLRLNDSTGFPVPICASIMGRFYHELAKRGHPQQIGFYTQEPRPADDHACPIGPDKGARKHDSGYDLSIEVINYWVYPDGRITLGGIFMPGI
ncbi:MAG: hypothetical protein V1861_03230 [Candidatus Micrarchaeota archaeon]